MTNKGKLIVIEGLDGSGKHTQATLLKQYLKQKGYKATLVTFPNYESNIGKLIKLYLDKRIELNQFTLNTLYSADRYARKENLEEALDSGVIVIADRYTPSNIAYGSFNGDTIERIRIMDQFLPQPNLIILVDIDPTTAARRLNAQIKDRNEQDLEYLQRVRKNYLIEYYVEQEKWRIVDGTEGEEEVHKQIIELVNEIL